MVEQQFFNNDLKVYRFITDTFNSNSYIVEYKGEVLVIDPGEKETKNVISWLNKKNKKPTYCLITHEHFDHNIGYNNLKEAFDFKTYCSLETKEAIANAKKNLSFYFKTPTESEVINYSTKLPNFAKVFKTPGHSKGSLCFLVENNLFSGDTIIKKEFLVSKLPGGNKMQLQKSIEKIDEISKNINNLKVFPGHGDVFKYNTDIIQ